MDYIGNSHQQNREMLTQMGLSDVMELFQAIPKELLCPQPKDVGLAEMEGIRLMESLAEQNDRYDAYLGGGAYDHYIPALTRAIIAKSGFLTSYTPYQAEVSQGVLQAIYEFQSAICALTGMDVANASVYDGANACAEAVLMALRVHPHRKKVILSPHLHPHYRA
ncbi:MAG: glycine dehydrogenase, partial [Chlamydiia bacterium]|nr:glycine dehydrogenase [Chlamydiia bacterium]